MSEQQILDACLRIANECAGLRVRRVARRITNLYNAALAPAKIEGAQFSLLVACRLAGPVAVTRLAEITGIDRTSLTRNLERLEKAGWIQIQGGKDRRKRLVHLTDSGAKAIEQALPAWDSAQHEVIRSFGAERLANLLKELRDLEISLSDPAVSK